MRDRTQQECLLCPVGTDPLRDGYQSAHVILSVASAGLLSPACICVMVNSKNKTQTNTGTLDLIKSIVEAAGMFSELGSPLEYQF